MSLPSIFRRVLWLAVLSGALSGSIFGFAFSDMESKITEFTLDNGMKFVVMEDHSAPVVAFELRAFVGGANDPKEFMGLSHFWEHMAFKGTSEIGTKDFAKEKKALEKLDAAYNELRAEELRGSFADSVRLGELQARFTSAQDEAEAFVETNEFVVITEQEGCVGLNAGTGYDFTGYYYSFPSNKLELWFYLESSRFADPVLRQFYKEKEVIKEERRMGIESSPIGRLVDELLHAAFLAHPYGLSLVGAMSDIQNFDKPAMMAHMRKYYVPANMVAAIVGDVNPAEVERLAKKYFMKLPRAPKPAPLSIEEPGQKAERRVILPDKAQPVLLIAYHRPSVAHPDEDVLYALADHLGGGRTSLLYTSLVKEKKIATQAAAFHQFPAALYPNLFGVYVTPAQGVTAEECEAAVYEEIAKLTSAPISEEELSRIKARARSAFINSLSTRDGIAGQLLSAEEYYGDWRKLFKALDKFEAITVEDMQRVAAEMFQRSNRTVAFIETMQD